MTSERFIVSTVGAAAVSHQRHPHQAGQRQGNQGLPRQQVAVPGGWGFAQFTDGKPDEGEVLKTCFACHAPAKDHDFVFTRYSP